MAKLIVILGFVLSFAAGMVIGSRSRGPIEPAAPGSTQARPPTTAPSEPRGRGSLLARELGLSAEQRSKADQIWTATAARGGNDHDDRRRDYRRDRDNAIADLVPTARLAEYDQIINTYNDRVIALEQESREAYADAVERTKQILTSEQRTRYEEFLKRHKWGPGAARDRHTSRRSETRPATSTTLDRPDSASPSHDSPKGAP